MTLLQKEIVWGNPKHATADSTTGQPSNSNVPASGPKKGRPRKSSTQEDLLLVEALKCGKTVERNECQAKPWNIYNQVCTETFKILILP